VANVRQFTVATNEIALRVTDYGNLDDPPVVLVHGLGQSESDWPSALLTTLVARQLRVITFDNRDIGHSTRITGSGKPPLLRLWLAAQIGWPCRWPSIAEPPYHIGDMARDTLALIRTLGLPRVHLVGASMGGMIAQHVAAACPSRLSSLVCIMSSPGRRGLPPPRRDVAQLMAKRSTASTPDRAAADALVLRRLLAGAIDAGDAAELESRVKLSTLKSWPDTGSGERQFAAILADRRRANLLPYIVTPTLVVHGIDDPLLPIAHGRALAEMIPGARFEAVATMGHEITNSLAPQVADLIASHIGA
jgi:pimeloyl-ACP methyl ester carboxylesterase